jgi:hypothetical protein
MSVTSAGASVTNTTAQVPIGLLRFDNGWIYGSGGPVLDPVSRLLVGQFSAGLTADAVPDSTIGRVFFLSLEWPHVLIRVFDRNNFTLVGTLRIPFVFSFTISSLVRWGDDGLAFRTADSQVFLIRIPSTWIGAPLTRRRGQITSQE